MTEFDNVQDAADAGAGCGELLRAINLAGGEPARLADEIAGNMLVSTVMMQLLGAGEDQPMSEAIQCAKQLLDILPPEFEYGRSDLETMVDVLSTHLAKQTKH